MREYRAKKIKISDKPKKAVAMKPISLSPVPAYGSKKKKTHSTLTMYGV